MSAHKRLFLLAPIALSFAILYMFLSHGRMKPAVPVLPGRNNTVLFMTTEASGLSNVHIAATAALLEEHPFVEIHFASFQKLRKRLNRISSAAAARNPNIRPIEFHELPGPDITSSILREVKTFDKFITAPGSQGLKKSMEVLGLISAPWDRDEYWAIYSLLVETVEKVDPAIIILDALFMPARDLVPNLNRRFTFLSPNTVTELFALDQPWGAEFWKYPALGSGYPFPLPWKLIPSNILLNLRMILGVLTNPRIRLMQKFLKERGVKSPIDPGFGVPGIPAIIGTFPEANLPLDMIPNTAVFCGPIVVDMAPAEEQDLELSSWLRQGPTIMVNLGSLVEFSQERAAIIIEAFRIVLASMEDIQVLWKFPKSGTYGDEVLNPVKGYIANGRLRVETWLQVDPVSLLKTGDIAVSVHHGGANCFHEAIIAGVPQVILPLWYDLYGVARTAEYVGVGLWPGQETSPDWEAGTLAKGFLDVLKGEKSISLRDKARSLAETARNYGGAHTAAKHIAQMAAEGKGPIEA